MNSDQRPKGLSTLPTSEVVLAPDFLDDVKKIAPKPRRSKLWIVFLLAIVGAGGFFAWKRYWPRRHVDAPSVTAPVETAAATPSVTASVVEPVASASATASASSPSASAIPSAAASASTSAPKVKRRRGH